MEQFALFILDLQFPNQLRAHTILLFMALSLLTSLLTVFSLFAPAITVSTAGDDPPPIFGKEKLSHIHFYFHDIVSGPNPTAIRVAEAPTTNQSATGFGAVVMMDDPLTEGPDLKSKLVGRAQGIYAYASQNDVGILMTLNFVFVSGEYNGSTLSVLGRNAALNKVREMPVVGGSGFFRWARGYALASTVSNDLKSGDAVVEYNVYVLHY